MSLLRVFLFSLWETVAVETEMCGRKTGNKNMVSVPENCWKQDCRTVKKTCRDWLVNLKMGLDGIHPKVNEGQEVNFQTQSQNVFIQQHL